jgi:hypothetical protein
MMKGPTVLATLAIAGAIATGGASAAQRTMIGEFTGLDCLTNQEAEVRSTPDVASPVLFKLPNETPVRILGGKQFGAFVAFPNTDAEFARIWFQIRTGDSKIGWSQSGGINCGG